MAGEEETETFAFQAEINQLLSLIINVRSGTCFVCDVPLPESVVFFSRANLFIGTRAFFLSSLRMRDDTDPFLSLFNARIHRRSTRTKRSFCENWSGTFICLCVFFFRKQQTKERSESSFVDATVRRSFPDRRRIGLSLFWRWFRRKLTRNNTSQLLLCCC